MRAYIHNPGMCKAAEVSELELTHLCTLVNAHKVCVRVEAGPERVLHAKQTSFGPRSNMFHTASKHVLVLMRTCFTPCSNAHAKCIILCG